MGVSYSSRDGVIIQGNRCLWSLLRSRRMWVCLFWEAGVMGVCASSSSHIVKASWRCLVGINGDVKPQERGEKEKARGRKCPSLFHEHTHDRGRHMSQQNTQERRNRISAGHCQKGITWSPHNATLISYSSCASSIRKSFNESMLLLLTQFYRPNQIPNKPKY